MTLKFWWIRGSQFYYDSEAEAQHHKDTAGLQGNIIYVELKPYEPINPIEYPLITWRKCWLEMTTAQWQAAEESPNIILKDSQGRKVMDTKGLVYDPTTFRQTIQGVTPRRGLVPIYAGTYQADEQDSVHQHGRNHMVDLKTANTITDFFFDSIIQEERDAGAQTVHEFLSGNPDYNEPSS